MAILLQPGRCLIVEDQALIAMTVEWSVEETGFWTCDQVYSVRDAKAALARTDYDVAVLDYILNDGSCTELAAGLRARKIPFIVHSGFRRPVNLPEVFRDVPWIAKPAEPRSLAAALMAVAGPRPVVVASDRPRSNSPGP